MPRSYQVTPEILGRRRATKRMLVRALIDRQPMSQLAASPRTNPVGRTSQPGNPDVDTEDQPNGVDAGRADDQVEREVLALLLESRLPGPWSVWELGLEVGSELRRLTR